MFRDAREVADGEILTTDLCVVGAGAAGIAIALQFAATSTRVLLLEGGGIAHHVTERGVYKVVYAPRPALVTDPDLAWRFGGNTNHWFGNCGPLDDADFASRPWVPHSGWPLRRAD